MEADVVVVGAGPTGGHVARIIASAGYDVLVMEEHHQVGLPIQCAGLVTPRVFDLAGIEDMDGIVQSEITGARFYSPGGHPLTIDAKKTRALVIDREAFDKMIMARAQMAGAKLQLGVKATSVTMKDEEVRVGYKSDSKRDTIRCRLIIGADGHRSRVSSMLSLPMAKERVIGYEADVSGSSLEPGMVEIYSGNGVAPGFFAWIIPFPERDGPGKGKVNARVGLCVQEGRGEAKRFFDDFMKSPLTVHALSGAKPVRTMAGKIPLGLVSKTYTDRTMIVGDAAAQVKPTSGGGVSTGLQCARVCGEVAVEALEANDLSKEFLARYKKRCKPINQELKRGMRLRRTFFTLSDRQLEEIFEILDNEEILSLISEKGDIDLQWSLASAVFRKAPRLMKYAGPYLRSYFK